MVDMIGKEVKVGDNVCYVSIGSGGRVSARQCTVVEIVGDFCRINLRYGGKLRKVKNVIVMGQ